MAGDLGMQRHLKPPRLRHEHAASVRQQEVLREKALSRGAIPKPPRFDPFGHM